MRTSRRLIITPLFTGSCASRGRPFRQTICGSPHWSCSTLWFCSPVIVTLTPFLSSRACSFDPCSGKCASSFPSFVASSRLPPRSFALRDEVLFGKQSGGNLLFPDLGTAALSRWYLLRQADSAHKFLEARIRADSVECRVNPDVWHVAVSVLKSLLQPVKCFILFSQSCIGPCNSNIPIESLIYLSFLLPEASFSGLG